MMTKRLMNGLVLVFLGAILLMNTTGYLPWSVWDSAISYWPILLIGLGIQVAFSRWKVPGLALAFLVILVLAAMNPSRAGSRPYDRPWRFRMFPKTSVLRPLEGNKEFKAPLSPRVSRLKLDMRAPSVEIEIKGAPELNEKSEPEALVANLSWDRTEPQCEFSQNESADELKVALTSPVWSDDAGKQVWNVSLNPSLITAVNVAGGVADLTMDCSSVFLENLTVSTGVAKLDISLGLTGRETKVVVSSGVANVSFKVPETAGVRLSVSGPPLVTRLDFSKNGLVKEGGAWVTRDYSNASTRFDIRVSCGAGKISLDRTGR